MEKFVVRERSLCQGCRSAVLRGALLLVLGRGGRPRGVRLFRQPRSTGRLEKRRARSQHLVLADAVELRRGLR